MTYESIRRPMETIKKKKWGKSGGNMSFIATNYYSDASTRIKPVFIRSYFSSFS